MKSNWKPIREYESLYKINQFGEVMSVSKDKGFIKSKVIIRKPKKRKDGYLSVGLWKDGSVKHFSVHRLVAIHFIKNNFNKSCINHKNGIKSDNIYTNLEWVSPSENTLHAFRYGLNKSIGENHHNNKLKRSQVLEILKSDESCKILAQRYKVCFQNIRRIKRGETWKNCNVERSLALQDDQRASL